MLTIWGRLNSHNVKKVAWLAEELAIPYVRHDVGGKFGMSDSYLALNPNAQIPTVDDNGFVLWESNAILRYLAARHGGAQWWPSNPATRALADRWMDWQIDYAETQREAFVNLVRRPAEERDPTAIALSAERTGKKMLLLDRHLATTPWLSGDGFGIGDIPMGVYAHTWFSLAIERPDTPHVSDWYRRLQCRDGYASLVMIRLT